MNYLKKVIKIIFTIFFFQFNSCGLRVIENHGQIYEKNVNFEELNVGKTTKDEITESDTSGKLLRSSSISSGLTL